MSPEFTEAAPFSPIKYTYTVNRRLFSGRSCIQDIEVWESDHFGRILTLDGVVQLTERDEFVYHEMLAHVPLYAHPRPSSILIVGGGDGGTLREVVKHPDVRKAVLVELDPMVVEVAQEFFPNHCSGFGDERAELVFADGAEYVTDCGRQFDIVIVDSTDPVGAAEKLYSTDFFARVHSSLHEGGVFVIQSESLYFHLETVRMTQRRLGECFPVHDLYTAPIATYPGNWWSFSISSKGPQVRRPARAIELVLRYYDLDVHTAAFLPRSLLQKLRIPHGESSRLGD